MRHRRYTRLPVKTTSETLEGNRVKLSVEVDEADFARDIDAAFSKIAQEVRLPGYLLPLEITGKKVTEFLLVPWVGACIHTPPPPPNQIVHVRLDKPYEMGGLFAPVWVTGRLAAGAVKRQLTLVDGSADIDIGYAMRASAVETYKEP